MIDVNASYIISAARIVIRNYPTSKRWLSGKARWLSIAWDSADDDALKSYDDFERRAAHLIKAAYNGTLGGEFQDGMAALIGRQVSLAYRNAWTDTGEEGAPEPEYLKAAADNMILGQYALVDNLYHDIVDARVDKTPLEPLMARAALWANRYNEAYADGLLLIAQETGGKLKWVFGETEEHCVTCLALDGKVALASEWEEFGLHPQGAPNDHLECGGWKCKCKLTPTQERRSRNIRVLLARLSV